LTSRSRWTNQRIAFGKPLHAQAVIRSKLAAMIARVEACQAWVENITHQMNNVRSIPKVRVLCATPLMHSMQMSYHEQSDKLAGPIALLKQYAILLFLLWA